MCLRTRGIPDVATTFSVEAAGQVYKQAHDFVYLGGNINHDADLSIEVNRRNTTRGAASVSTPSNCMTDRVLL